MGLDNNRIDKIYEIYGDDAHTMTRELMLAADIASRIPKGASVALKPNLVLASAPERGATTHAGVLSGVISYLRENGFDDISVIEGSWVGDDTKRAYKAAGYDKVCEEYGVSFYDLKRDKTRSVETPFGAVKVCCRALDAGYLINLPVLKGHCQTVMTCALKNCKGCLPDSEKRRFHSAGLMKPIAALACALRPDLTIVDSICGDLSFEEGGNPVPTGRMFMGSDCVQLDAYGCRLMGIELSDVPYIHYAEAWGAGSTQLRAGDFVYLNSPDQAGSYPKELGKKAARLTSNVKQDAACSACYASLVRALYNMGAPGAVPVAIGQGWKGKSFDGIGVGRCCDRASIKIPGCPPTADEIIKAFRQLR